MRRWTAALLAAIMACAMCCVGLAESEVSEDAHVTYEYVATATMARYADGVSMTGASSSGDQRDKYGAYVASNAFDGNTATTWCENAAGQGESMWLAGRWQNWSGGWMVTGVAIWAGYQKDSSLYAKNSRPSDIQLTFIDANGALQGDYLVTLGDSMTCQYVVFDQPMAINGEIECRLTLWGAYPGSKYSDNCVCEMDLLLVPAAAAGAASDYDDYNGWDGTNPADAADYEGAPTDGYDGYNGQGGANPSDAADYEGAPTDGYDGYNGQGGANPSDAADYEGAPVSDYDDYDEYDGQGDATDPGNAADYEGAPTNGDGAQDSSDASGAGDAWAGRLLYAVYHGISDDEARQRLAQNDAYSQRTPNVYGTLGGVDVGYCGAEALKDNGGSTARDMLEGFMQYMWADEASIAQIRSLLAANTEVTLVRSEPYAWGWSENQPTFCDEYYLFHLRTPYMNGGAEAHDVLWCEGYEMDGGDWAEGIILNSDYNAQ